MVCSLGGGQMTTLLEGGSTSQIMAEDVGCWKLAAQYVQRELKEADEVNLLDEEDMHVFGLRPMMDPLILVCCNSCKKPVKASQYATHADICKSLSSVVDNTTEVDVVGGQKKPPRKERKKLQICISTQVPSVGKPERSALSNTAASNSNLDEQTLKATSFPIQVKGRDFTNESQARSLKIFDSVTSLQKPRKLEDHHLQTKGMSTVPAPLATKIFYSQRTQRLRSAISHMYYRSSTQHDQGLSNMQFSDSNKMTPWTSAHSYSYPEKIDGQHEKLGNQVPCMVENRDPVPAKSSEAISDESRTILPKKLSDHFHMNNALGPQRRMGNLASDFLQNPCPFGEN
ncbi:uncharacterized protein LOC112529278 isoform X2 [Cynara cardunculus var. scolymus]|uniref:uncharacterized protein LOC112529278 isoform X2 n=1 Tax=Cynara cardunculus var. scolymus TaxID=59895 RepID=UPI000D62B380|nr:uncharacterized protein LOC112529278 isoform X2 [Cynara cardunculus var. scolymus]